MIGLCEERTFSSKNCTNYNSEHIMGIEKNDFNKVEILHIFPHMQQMMKVKDSLQMTYLLEKMKGKMINGKMTQGRQKNLNVKEKNTFEQRKLKTKLISYQL